MFWDFACISNDSDWLLLIFFNEPALNPFFVVSFQLTQCVRSKRFRLIIN